MHFGSARPSTVLYLGKNFIFDMKWKRLATEFLPEKTFLIIRDDLKSLGAKENSTRRAKPKSALDTGTWPPKLKYSNKNRHRRPSVADERPKTANLEGPSVLDPRLLNKLDMSLVRKELLGDSMTRIHRSVKNRVGGGVARNRTSDGKRRRQSVPIGEKSCTFTRASCKHASNNISDDDENDDKTKVTISLPSVIAIGSKKANIEHSNNYVRGKRDANTNSPRMKKSTERRDNISSGESRGSNTNGRTIEIKRLDDNNNKNNLSSNANEATKIWPLTSVKISKTSRVEVSTEIEVFTGAKIKSAPEPCKTCGRPDQPERFHSHPKSLCLSVKKEADSCKSKIAVPKTVQKPVALNFRSDKNKRNKELVDEQSVASTKERKSRNISPKRETKNEENDKATRSNSSRKGPRTVTCYICAREFGSASFPIHEPKCMQKWERENNSLSVSQRRAVPQRPPFPIDHYDWNTAAWEQSQSQLVPCWKCSRTYLPERLAIHEKSCKGTRKIETSGNSRTTEKPQNRVEATSRTVPSTVLCQICGRNFGTRSIKIHEPHCMKKWQADNESLSSSYPKKTVKRVERSADISSRDLVSITSPVRFSSAQKPTTTCYICGRDFGSASIDIHEPQCLRKWQNENSKLPAHQQRNEPQKPDIIYTSETSSGNPIVNWASTNEALWNSHLGQLVPCRHCKRTFNPDRVSVHERSCKGNR